MRVELDRLEVEALYSGLERLIAVLRDEVAHTERHGLQVELGHEIHVLEAVLEKLQHQPGELAPEVDGQPV